MSPFLLLYSIVCVLALILTTNAQKCQLAGDANNCDESLCSGINEARFANQLETPLQNSLALYVTAREHYKLLNEVAPSGTCDYNSWPADGPDNGKGIDEPLWKQCCIDDDTYVLEEAPSCQTDKPSELTAAWDDKRYVGFGYSMVIKGTFSSVESAVQGFKVDAKQRDTLYGDFYKSIGCKYEPPYAVVWFGDSTPKLIPYETDGELDIFFSASGAGDSTVIIVSCAVAGVVLLVAVAAVLFILKRKGKLGKRNSGTQKPKQKKIRKEDMLWDDSVDKIPAEMLGAQPPMMMNAAPPAMHNPYAPNMNNTGMYAQQNNMAANSAYNVQNPYAQNGGQWNAYY